MWKIQSRTVIFQSSFFIINFLYAALLGGTLLQSVMSQQNICLMELYINKKKKNTFHENVSFPYF